MSCDCNVVARRFLLGVWTDLGFLILAAFLPPAALLTHAWGADPTVLRFTFDRNPRPAAARLRHRGPAHTRRRRLQHPRAVLATMRTPRPRGRRRRPPPNDPPRTSPHRWRTRPLTTNSDYRRSPHPLIAHSCWRWAVQDAHARRRANHQTVLASIHRLTWADGGRPSAESAP
jgi:hypothetical protein